MAPANTPSVSFRCHMALFVLAVVVVGDGCKWQLLAMVTVVVVKQGWWW